jgi:hypothetical protein
MNNNRGTLDYFLTQLNIDSHTKSDPDIIRDILKNDMMLLDCHFLLSKFKSEFENPVDLYGMINDIKNGFYSSQPAVIEFIQFLNDEGTLSNIKGYDTIIIRMINYIYILNRLVEEAHRDPYWGKDMMNNVISNRKEYGIRHQSFYCLLDSYRISHDWFLSIKLASVNFVIKRYIARLNRNTHRPTLNSGYFGQVAWRSLLNINILEATLGDVLNKRWKNAKAGLMLVMFNNKKMNNDDLMRFGHSQEWASLYHTWNLAFITFELPHLDTMFPKLIAPIVTNAAPDLYIHNRVLALFLTFNSLVIHIKKGRNDSMHLPENTKLSDAWGTINLKYAHDMYEQETGEKFNGIKSIIREYIFRCINKITFLKNILLNKNKS